MAVPKKKTSPSRRGMRRSHDKMSKLNIVEDQKSGENKLRHRITPKEGTYKGKQIVKIKGKSNEKK